MARFGDFTIRTAEYRPCYVMEGTMYANDVAFDRKERKALFHRWTDKIVLFIKDNGSGMLRYEDYECAVRGVVERHIVSKHFDTEKTAQTFAIVEYEDGTIAEVEPTAVRFVPGIMNEYNFGEAAENETRNATD